MSTFEDRLAGALRAYAAEQETMPARRGLRALAPGGTRRDRDAPRRGRGLSAHAPGGAPRRRRAWALAPLAAAFATLVLLLVPGRDPAPASAAEFLRSAAAAAEREAPLPAGAYLYTRREFSSRRTDDGTSERWVRADGSGRTLVRDRAGRVVDDTRDGAGFVIGRERVTRLTDARGLLERQTRATIAENPGFAPDQLRAFTAYTILRDLLDTPSAAALRAEAYRELARTPGLRRGGDTVIARVGDVELRLTIDAGRVQAVERRLLRNSDQIPGPPGVIDHSEVVERGAVGSIRARP